MKAPQSPAALESSPGPGALTPSPTATGSSATTPAKKIIQERSVSDSSRPNRRSACTAGTAGVSAAAGQPTKATMGLASQSPSQPMCARTSTPVRSCASAYAARAPPRNTEKRRSAMPPSSRFRAELPTGLPLALGSQLGDLAVLIDRDDRKGIHRRAEGEVVPESPGGQGPAVRRGVEEPHQVVAVLPVDQRRGNRRVLDLQGGQPSGNEMHIPPRAGGVLQCELAVLPRAYERDVRSSPKRRAQHRTHRRQVDVRCHH